MIIFYTRFLPVIEMLLSLRWLLTVRVSYLLPSLCHILTACFWRDMVFHLTTLRALFCLHRSDMHGSVLWWLVWFWLLHDHRFLENRDFHLSSVTLRCQYNLTPVSAQWLEGRRKLFSNSVLNLHQKAGPLPLDFCQEEEQNPRLPSRWTWGMMRIERDHMTSRLTCL